VSHDSIFGVISLIFWSVTIIVTVTYVTLVMRADNDGEGGIMALIALIRRRALPGGSRAKAVLAGLGIFGASLFFGDSMITPAISGAVRSRGRPGRGSVIVRPGHPHHGGDHHCPVPGSAAGHGRRGADVRAGHEPLLIGLITFTIFTTWQRGRELVTLQRVRDEGPLPAFIEQLHAMKPPLYRVAGHRHLPQPG
jgi:K+ transporter